MKCIPAVAVAVLLSSMPAVGQEMKPVPKGSARVGIPGCTKDQILTAGRRTEAEPGASEVPEGTHLRMNGPKKLINEIKAHEGAFLVITGLMRTGQTMPGGVSVGGGIRIGPGTTNGSPTSSLGGQGMLSIDVEGWRQAIGDCPTR